MSNAKNQPSHARGSRRRHRGSGSVYQIKPGTWKGAAEVSYGVGARKRVTVSGKTRDEVERKLRETLVGIDHGVPVQDGRRTLGEWLDQWLEQVVMPRCRPATYKSREYIIRTYLKPYLGRIRLKELNAQKVDLFLTRLQETGASGSLTNEVRQVLVTALNVAWKRDLISRNPAAQVDRVHAEPIRPGVSLELDQIPALLEAARHSRLGVCFVLQLGLGLRPMEAPGLKWADIDWDKGQLTVRRQISRYPYGRDRKPERQRGRTPAFLPPMRKVEADLKTPRSHRTLPLFPFLRQLLQEQRRVQAKERLIMGSAWQDHDLVFTTTIGTALDRSTMATEFKSILLRAGLPHFKPRDLRTSCGTLLAYLKVEMPVVAGILGHTNPSTTLAYYAKAVPESVIRAGEAMDTLLRGDDADEAHWLSDGS